MQIGKARTSED